MLTYGASGVNNPGRSAAERNALAVDHLGLVPGVARKHFAGYWHDEATFDDLVGAGNLGLLGAASSFDPGRGTPFAAFAARRVWGAIVDHLRESGHLIRRPRVPDLSYPTVNRINAYHAEASTPSPVESADHVEYILRGLDARARDIILSRYVDGRPTAELADRYDCTQSNIRRIATLAKAKVRRRLQSHSLQEQFR